MTEGEGGAVSSHARALPARVGRYDILLPIASGGMATVYLARSRGPRGFARMVALKLAHPAYSSHGEFASIVLEEAKLSARIRHRNVVSILDVGEDPLGIFLVMDYVEGGTLAQLRTTAVPTNVGMRILLDALAGLHAAHELRDDEGRPLNVVHRDFSPQNILVGLDGVAQLTDFGIAKANDRAANTSTGVIKGKVSYMAPEQAKGQALDRRADVWSAGVVAWALFARQRLYDSEGVSTLLKLINERPRRIRSVNPEVHPAIDDAVARALEPQVTCRTPNAAAFATELAEAFGQVGRIASAEDVGAFIKNAVGRRLEARRAQVQNALKLREEMAALAEASIATTASVSSLAVEKQVNATASSGVIRSPQAAATVVPHEAPSVTTNTHPDGHNRHSPSAGESGRDDEVDGTTLDGFAGRRARARRWPVVIAAAVCGILLALGGALSLGSRASSPAIQAPASAMPAIASAAPSATAPQQVDPPAPDPRLDTIEVRANAPMVSFRVNDRVVALAEPSKIVTLERPAPEREANATVVAVAVDGRQATTRLGAGATTVDLTFSTASVARPRAAAPAPARPAPRLTGLAPSPYDNR